MLFLHQSEDTDLRKKFACKPEQGEDIRVNIGIKVRLRNDNGSSSTNPDKKTPLLAKNEQKLPAKKNSSLAAF